MNRAIMIIIRLICIVFLCFVFYKHGELQCREDIKQRALLINKEVYTGQDVEIIIFGEIQE